MPISVSNQVHIFLWAVAGGMLVAFIYDLFRIKRRAFKTNAIIINIEDLVYWMIVAIVMVLVVYYSNEGEVRGYIFIGWLIGVVLYVLLLSRPIINSSLFVIGVIYRIFKTIWMIISYPFKLMYKILSVPGRFIYKIFLRFSKTARRAGKARLQKAVLFGKRFKNIRKKI